MWPCTLHDSSARHVRRSRRTPGYVAVAIAVEQLGAALGAEGGTCAAAQAIVNHLFPLSKDGKIDWTHGDNESPVACTTVFL